MISVTAIDKALVADFSSTIRGRGEAYLRLGMVSKVDYSVSLVEGEVRGAGLEPYKVVFEYDLDKSRFHGECSCPEEDTCKHQAAVLYALKEKVMSAPPTQRLTKSPKRVEKRKAEPKIVRIDNRVKQRPQVAKKVKKPLEGGATTNEYRLLPIYGHNFSAVLQEYKPRVIQNLSWNESFEGRFISDTEMEVETTTMYPQYHFKPQKIVLKNEEGKGLWVKCLSCDEKSSNLCQHQMVLLTKVQTLLHSSGFLSGKMDFNTLIKTAETKTGVSPDAFDKYFAITIDPSGFNLRPKIDNFVGKDWLQQTQSFLDSDKKNRQKTIKSEEQRLEEGRSKRIAFFWGMTDAGYASEDMCIRFVKGNGYKTKDGINAANREVNNLPINFPEPYHSLGRELFFLNQEENPLARFEGVQRFILKNREALNEIYQFVGNGDLAHNNIRASDLHLVQFNAHTIDCRFSVYKKDGLIHFERHITVDEQAFNFPKIVHFNDFFCTTKDKAYLYSGYRFNDFMNLFKEQDTIIIPFTNKVEYTRLIKGLQQHFEVTVDAEIMLEEEVLKNPEYQILLRELGTFILFEPRLKYGEYSFNAFEEDSFQIEDKVYRVEDADRHFLIEFLKNTHPEFNNPIQVQDYVFLDIKSMINDYWFVHFNEICEATGVEVVGVQDLTKFKYSKHKAATYSHVKSGIDWFDVDMGLSFGDEVVKTADWIKALRNKESFVRLKDGSLGILPEEWLQQARNILAVADVEKGELKISKYRFNIIEDLFDDLDDKDIVEELRAKKARLVDIELNKKYPIPEIITAELRDYQKHGYEWLKFLDESGFGGILADDMGLGKTLQVISLLADQIDAEPSLVIVPRSLLFNWAAELDKFCPSLKYVIHHGANRFKSLEEILPCNIIITTYGTAASDIEMFKDFKFNYIILDESQAIKNPDSKRYKAMRLLQSNNKIAMTGTPIENNTFDLYAQLSFTSPGLLGSKTSFKNSFAVPIDNNNDVEAANLLRKLVHPFLLRRTKDQVAKDLPEKTESIIYCEMGPTQRKLYNNLKRKIKEDIETEVEQKGLAKSKFRMLDGLLRLRQMCNSPLLVNKTFSGSNAESVKINILIDHLTEGIDQHNALVFSQFVSLLSILRAELDKRGIKYAYLDGSTTKRQAEVDKFMKNDEIKIFLISLKAGNTGMNLTKADYVYILDPWWNPAVEAQAIDRTHRIGQDKQIFAYKLICKDSIEEKILKLQEKKSKLAKDIIRTDENVLKSLQKDELMALFD